MCHEQALNVFPKPGDYQQRVANGLYHWHYQAEQTTKPKRLAIMTDIYGCNEFYQSFATYFSVLGWEVELMNLFVELGELKEITREAAFERRHKLRDRDICNKMESFITEQNISAVIGFCLGGNYVFELARRGVNADLVAYYPFPAGLPNEDTIPVPFEYLGKLDKNVTVLAGDADDRSGRNNMLELAKISEKNSALNVHLYPGSDHGFLTQLDSEDDVLRRNAEDSLKVCLQTIEH